MKNFLRVVLLTLVVILSNEVSMAQRTGVNRVPTTRFDLSQGLETGYYLLKQVNNNASAAGGQGVGWIKAASETVGASATSKNTGTPSATDCTYIWYVEVVDAENKTITISTANKVAAWQAPHQHQKNLVAYADRATLKYHTETVNLSGNATPKEGSCFLSTQDGSAYVHFSGDYLGSWTDTNQNSMFMVEFYKVSNDLQVNVTYEYYIDGEKMREETKAVAVGTAFNATGFDYLTINYPDGNVTAETTTVRLDCEQTFPFQTSTSFADATWYYMTIRSNNQKYVSRSENTPVTEPFSSSPYQKSAVSPERP